MATILVIDDEPEFLNNLAEMLELEDFDVITSCDGTEALENIRERHVDLILCDMLMRPMDGMKILRAVRENSSSAHIPFVFITGLKPDQIQGGVAEASGFLIKPFTNDTLLAVVSEQLEM
jgi:two-component system, sensor histidine kinase and response regulator